MLRKRKTLWWLLVVGVTLGAEGEGAAEEWRLWRNSGSSISQKYHLPSKRRDLSDHEPYCVCHRWRRLMTMCRSFLIWTAW